MSLDTLTELMKSRDGWKQEALHYRAAYEKVRKERNALADVIDGNVWYWQGDEKDNLESLTCNIVISPDKLKNLFSFDIYELWDFNTQTLLGIFSSKEKAEKHLVSHLKELYEVDEVSDVLTYTESGTSTFYSYDYKSSHGYLDQYAIINSVVDKERGQE